MQISAALIPIALVAYAPLQSEGLTVISDPHFQLALGDEWSEIPDDEPERYNLFDEERDVAITLSAMGINAAPDQLEMVANKMIDARLAGEERMAQEFGLRLTIAEPMLVERPWGYAIAYYGSDQNGRQFSFSGIITTNAVISLYMSSGKLSEKELMAVMDEVASQIEFDRSRVR